MTKGKTKPAAAVTPIEDQVLKVFTSSRGIDIQIRPISQFKLDAVRASREEVPVPTYEADLAGGDKETLALDAISAKNKGREEEWKQYLLNVEVEKKEFGKRFNDFICYLGVEVEVPDEESQWQKISNSLKIKIPEDEVQRKVFYINTELLGTPQDMGDLITTVLQASRLAPEVIEKMKDTFRTALERKTNLPVPAGEVAVENK